MVMKIGLQTWGTDGDVRPFLALAGGLSAAGHEVSLVVTSLTNKKYHHYAQELGFAISHVGSLKCDHETVQLLSEKIRETKIPLKQVQIVLENFFDPLIPEMYAAAEKLCRENDLIIGHFLHHPAMVASEKAGKPYVTVTLNHGGISSAHVPPLGCPNLGRLLNPLCWKFVKWLVDYTLAGSINKLRLAEGLQPLDNIFDHVWTSRRLNLLAVSKSLCHPQEDWAKVHKISGFLNIPQQAENRELPANLRNFIENGPAPVFMTFGSMLDLGSSPALITRILVDGALQAGCRAIVQSRWDELADFPDHPDICKIGPIPHQHLFPRCSCVVHHGGAGTSHSATMHGCPSVVIEHFGDQVLFGHELNRLGIAPKILHRRNLTAEKLAKSLRKVLGNREMKERAARLGALIKKEDGVATAVKTIEQYFAGSG